MESRIVYLHTDLLQERFRVVTNLRSFLFVNFTFITCILHSLFSAVTNNKILI